MCLLNLVNGQGASPPILPVRDAYASKNVHVYCLNFYTAAINTDVAAFLASTVSETGF